MSIDGQSPIHDTNRRIRSSHQGSFERILENIKRIPVFERKDIFINTVISPEHSCNIIERLNFIRRMGFVNIRFYPAFQFSRWSEKAIVNFERAMLDFSKQYCDNFLNKKISDLFFIDFLKEMLTSKLIKKGRTYCLENKLEDCNTVWLDFSGNFYVCERIAGLDFRSKERFQIGDSKKGINLSARDRLLSKAGRRFRNFIAPTSLQVKDCFFCPLSFYFLESDTKTNVIKIERAFSFYCRIMSIYKRSFYMIYRTLKNDPLFKNVYALKE